MPEALQITTFHFIKRIRGSVINNNLFTATRVRYNYVDKIVLVEIFTEGVVDKIK